MKRFFLSAVALFLAHLSSHGQASLQMRNVGTLQELLLRSPVPGQSILVSGRRSVGDWGGPRLFIATNAIPSGPNEAHFFNPGGGTNYWMSADWNASRQNLRWFGALADGLSDDTTSFQAAIDYAATLGGVVYVPHGSYLINGDLSVTSTVKIQGEPMNSSALLYTGTNYLFTLGGGTNSNVRGIELHDLFLIGWAPFPYNGAYALTNSAGMIKVHGATRGVLNNIRTSNARSGNGILFKDRAWIWSVRNYQCFDLQNGIRMECAAGYGDLVSAIHISGGEISGCDWGILVGRTDATLGTAERGLGTLTIDGGIAVEGNRIGGIWLNQAENVNLQGYWEGNPETCVRLGNQYDTNAWSVSGVHIVGNRFATGTNAVQIYAANNVRIDANDAQDMKGSGYPLAYMSTNHTSVVVTENNRARQSTDSDYNWPVIWADGHGSVVRQLTEDPVGNALLKDSANAMFGDDPKSWATIDRLQNFSRWIGVNSTNGPVGLMASMLGTSPGTQTRAFVGTDNTNVVIGGRRDSGGMMPVRIESNGSGLMTLDGTQTANPNRFVVGGTNGYDRLTVHGSALIGDPTNNTHLNFWDKHLSIAGYTNADSIGLSFVSYDQGNNRMLRIGIDPAVPEAVIQTTYSSGGQIPIVFRSAFGDDIMVLTRSNVLISGTIGWNGSFRTNWPTGASGSSFIDINSTNQISTPNFAVNPSVSPVYYGVSGTNVYILLLKNAVDLDRLNTNGAVLYSLLAFDGTNYAPTTNLGTITADTLIIRSNFVGTIPATNIDAAIARLASPALTGTPLVNGTNLMLLIDGKQASDADLDDLADGSLTGTKVGTGISADNITSGSLGTNRLPASITGKQDALSFTDGVTNSAGTVKLAISPGSSITLTTNSGRVTIAATRTGVARTIVIPASAFDVEASEPATAFTNTWATTTDRARELTWRFSASATNGICAGFVWPQTWAATACNVRLFWKQLTAESGTTNVWSVALGSASDTDTMGAVLGTAVQIQDSGPNDTNKVAVTSWSSGITVGNTPAAGDLAIISVRRLPGHASDNAAAEAVLLRAVIEYTESSTEPTDN